MKYFRITDDCGWTYTDCTDNDEMTPEMIVLLTPYVRKAEEITLEEYERSGRDEQFA